MAGTKCVLPKTYFHHNHEWVERSNYQLVATASLADLANRITIPFDVSRVEKYKVGFQITIGELLSAFSDCISKGVYVAFWLTFLCTKLPCGLGDHIRLAGKSYPYLPPTAIFPIFPPCPKVFCGQSFNTWNIVFLQAIVKKNWLGTLNRENGPF